jgi:hypothetical protein
MNQTPRNTVSDEDRLGALAMEFRGRADKAKRKRIAKDYSDTVERLIRSGTWKDMPAPEDQLPDAFMPASFFAYWSRP